MNDLIFDPDLPPLYNGYIAPMDSIVCKVCGAEYENETKEWEKFGYHVVWYRKCAAWDPVMAQEFEQLEEGTAWACSEACGRRVPDMTDGMNDLRKVAL